MQLILAACSKPDLSAGDGITKYYCQKYEMFEDSSGVISESVKDTTIYVSFDYLNAILLDGEKVKLDEENIPIPDTTTRVITIHFIFTSQERMINWKPLRNS